MVLADLDPELYSLRLGVPASVLGKVKNIGVRSGTRVQ
jgi:hypothetical protein